MSQDLLVSIVGLTGTFVTALSALLLLRRGFSYIERQLKLIESDFKELYKDLIRRKVDITALTTAQNARLQ